MEPGKLEAEKPAAHSARNLLLGAFKKAWEKLPSVKKLHAEHMQMLLKTPLGRDFTLVTAAGVLFKVHSTMLFDPASKASEELKPDNFSFYNATFLPADSPPSPAVAAMLGVRKHIFHLCMYALAEELAYPALRASAYDVLTHLFVMRRGMSVLTLESAIEAAFAPPGDAARICKDEDGARQNAIVASVIAHEAKNWSDKNCQDLAQLLQGDGYAPFWSAYNAAKAESDGSKSSRRTRNSLNTAGIKEVQKRSAKQKSEAQTKANDADDEAGQDGDQEIEF